MTKVPEAFIRIGVNTSRHKTITVDDFNGDQAAFLAYGMTSSILKPLYSEEYLAAPPLRELSNDEIFAIAIRCNLRDGRDFHDLQEFAKAILAAARKAP